MTIEAGKTVALHYTLRLENGKVYETTDGEEPLIYQHGTGEIVAGLEQRLEGLEKGAQDSFVIPALEGYGEVKIESLIEVPKEHIPEEAREVGSEITAVSRNGHKVKGVVYEIKKDYIVVDFNHPLAGMDLYFDITVVDVMDPPNEEAR
ncbi:FKBP-type peptidyl-prolyl cis-trans isomerase [Desulfogranum japonicum]|uniref:FKBP-type peptidyl-prolyl cis-trans isomerase n=1 Tax=Desulfogranum japonicum TaxID=231447 RepID=UPI000404F5D7|nr:FKBP-type peptidyl-prolyl cis-trans isomerase [Desulfogranum japonicum]